MKQILSIQYLRAFAALNVVVFHQHWVECGKNLFPAGAGGVDLFFVISGFIMFTLTEKQETAPGEFFWRRLVRIVPLYYCMTVLTIFVRMFWSGYNPKHVDISIQHVIASFFFIPHFAAGTGDHIVPTVPQGWTLNLEMFFYVLMSSALFVPRRFQLPLLSAVLFGLALIGRIFYPQPAIPNLFTNCMILEFLAGLWLGQFWAWKALPGRKAGFFILGTGLVFFWLQQWLTLDAEMLRPSAAAVLVVLGALSIETHGGIFSSSALKLLGDASYSIYLTHELVLWVIKNLHLPYPLSIFIGGGAVIGIGLLVYLYLERPLLAALRKIPPWHFLPQGKKATAAARRRSR